MVSTRSSHRRSRSVLVAAVVAMGAASSVLGAPLPPTPTEGASGTGASGAMGALGTMSALGTGASGATGTLGTGASGAMGASGTMSALGTGPSGATGALGTGTGAGVKAVTGTSSGSGSTRYLPAVPSPFQSGVFAADDVTGGKSTTATSTTGTKPPTHIPKGDLEARAFGVVVEEDGVDQHVRILSWCGFLIDLFGRTITMRLSNTVTVTVITTSKLRLKCWNITRVLITTTNTA
ncbi:hypothetical protein J3R30DRAFT_635413 [Lentinula aciculospora]|uniref:Uncharacterized protein n=1 Tax=Lentinula aciculospora TaxID=153920 RepID=A0A9W9A6X6_9AGAR|nr:hypothetical protein J3R30DRAFT_635413 [Lentinula aciculospora]